MNISEAKIIVDALCSYTGQVVAPMLNKIKGFVIVPKEKRAYDAMFRDIKENYTRYEQALHSFRNDVTILVCFEGSQLQYCEYSVLSLL